MVAEKSMFWRRSGSSRRMRLMSGRKPMSSMWSPSSNTRVSISSRRTSRLPIRSKRRPGQATMISGFLCRARFCPARPMPPKMATERTFVKHARRPISLWICRASSRVGARIRARGPLRWPLAASRRSMIGRAKAAVLPVPVWARPRTSRPWSAAGMVSAWTGRGSVKPASPMARMRFWLRSKDAKLSRDPLGRSMVVMTVPVLPGTDAGRRCVQTYSAATGGS